MMPRCRMGAAWPISRGTEAQWKVKCAPEQASHKNCRAPGRKESVNDIHKPEACAAGRMMQCSQSDAQRHGHTSGLSLSANHIQTSDPSRRAHAHNKQNEQYIYLERLMSNTRLSSIPLNNHLFIHDSTHQFHRCIVSPFAHSKPISVRAQ
jgi:hypothetical protein